MAMAYTYQARHAAEPRPDDDELARLWDAYKHRGDRHARQELISRYWPLVKYEAKQIRMRLSYQAAPLGDLQSYGAEGLIKAVDRFDLGRGVRFATFATHLIKGAIMDGVRSEDWASRSVRRKAREIHEVRNHLWNARGRAPTEEEEAEALDLPVDTYRTVKKAIADAEISHLETYDLDEVVRGRAEDEPFEAYVGRERRQRVREAIDALPERERTVVALSFGAEMTLAQIGEYLGGITESRVCQIRMVALKRLCKMVPAALG
ncbi:MAG: sigma-70 family RNA polymerase sigma factor [Acidimicrobiales bacterium]